MAKTKIGSLDGLDQGNVVTLEEDLACSPNR